MRKAFFGMEGIEGGIYEGFTNGDRWNGWACPYFTLEVGKKIMTDLKGQAEYTWADYNKEHDEFITNYEGLIGDSETWEGMDIEVEGEIVHVYPIGAFGWVWSEIENATAYEYDEYFQGKVIIASHPTDWGYSCELWVYNEVPFYWGVDVSDKEGKIKNNDDLLEELKKIEYVYEGASITI